MQPKILIVGAGPVGTVYSRYFHLGGADVSFLVREKYANVCRQGFCFYEMNRSRALRSHPVKMQPLPTLTTNEEVANKKWDFVVLAMSSTALQGPWLEGLVSVIGTATLVTLQPGLADREYLLQHVDSRRLVEGSTQFASYCTPLPGEKVPMPGIAYWFPPGPVAFFSGSGLQVKDIVDVLQKGGFSARSCKSMVASAILVVLVAALEASNWSFNTLLKGTNIKLACRAVAEVLQIMRQHEHVKISPFIAWLVQPFSVGTLLFLSRWIVPFDFEKLLQVHFTKVQDQMHQMMQDYMDLAHKYALSSHALWQLHHLLSKKNSEN